jgi:hypothetical protein
MLPLLGLLAQLGCGVGDSHPSQVVDTQVLAVVTEPAQPSPGQSVAVTVWVADPRDRGVELLVWSCTPYGDDDCVEREAGLNQMAAVFTEPGAQGRFSFSRYLPVALEAVFADSDQAPAALVWALACEPGLCPIIDDVRQALADPVDIAGADRVMDELADPVSWLRDLPLAGVNLAGRFVPLARTAADDRNQNPVVEQRFLTEDEVGQPVAVAASDARSVRFAVFDPNGTRSDAVAYTTVGRFDDHVVREDSQDDTVLHWLLAPAEPATGTLWVVFDDGDGGRSVWTAEVTVE